ncbi:Nicotinamide mononucleotide transporter [Proteiniphilum saccharofermentans]|jgi:nicotinamide mononucleotide transporter|uniref:Nicotinamide riboside transporter PnuC n=1 Tax=Proteiniphilum saccharofermentans TaxID=1642647 RepID=A0A1R3SYH5_9BACT|nr:nicotinamide riboside transporter PnuC [Proteiniphilum saccharofermentans]SCD21246.1 Nicotinamide mononucleotide transporter [Proteiniphilum saccharofermentans]
MQTIEIIGAVIGLLYLYLEYNANKWLWPVGVLMPIVYVWIFFQSKFYADMGINVYYFFASIYGWARWTKHKSEGSGLPIRHTPRRYIIPILTIGTALFAAIAFILIRFTDSPVPYGDSFTTALSILGMWLLAHKYVEQWWFWFFVNIISCGLYVWKGLYPTSILFAIYSVISVFGYLKWKRMMSSETTAERQIG